MLKPTKKKKAKVGARKRPDLRLTNAQRFKIIFQDEGADAALSVCERLGYSKKDALLMMRKWV